MNDELLTTQLRSYGAHFKSETSPLEVEDLATPLVVLNPMRHRPSRRLAAALVAAAVVLLVVVSILIVREAPPPVATTVPSGALNGWVAFAAPGVGDFDPEWRSQPAYDIFITREGEAVQRIIGADGDGLDQTCPRFSPDGTMLAYNEGHWPIGTPNNAEVVVVEFDGPTPGRELLRLRSTDPRCVKWSPDSDLIAYVATVSPGTFFEGDWNHLLLQVATLEGQEVTLFDSFHGHPLIDWSPDGSTIAVMGYRDNSYQAIWLVPADGQAPQMLVRHDFDSARTGWGPLESMAWSPDGSKIAILGWTEPGSTDDGFISFVGLDGTIEHSMPKSGLYQGELVSWSPDGTRLVHVDRSDGRVEIVNSDNDLTKLQPIELPGVGAPIIYPGPIWSPDAKSLLAPIGWDPPGALVILSADAEEPPSLLYQGDELLDDGGGPSWQPLYP